MSYKNSQIRNRSSNFTKVEKILVANLCRDNPDIDAKEYDKVTLQRKHDAWSSIMAMYKEEISKKDFNLPERDVKQIQGCWKRLKDQIRRCNNLSVTTNNSDANGSYVVMTNGYPLNANGDMSKNEPFSVNPDIYDNDEETEDESSVDNSNYQNQVDNSPEENDQIHVSFNPALRIKEERTAPDELTSWKNNDNVVTFINTPVSNHPQRETTHVPNHPHRETTHVPNHPHRETTHVPNYPHRETTHVPNYPHRETTHVPNVHVLERTTYSMMKRGHKRRRSNCDDDDDDDPYVQMAQEEHQLKMKILQLKEWKLRKECVKSGVGLPPDYEIPHNCGPKNNSSS